MKEAGLNQTTLAEKIGVTRQAVSDYLNKGSKPRGERVRPLADALNISEAELAARIEGADPSVPEDVITPQTAIIVRNAETNEIWFTVEIGASTVVHNPIEFKWGKRNGGVDHETGFG